MRENSYTQTLLYSYEFLLYTEIKGEHNDYFCIKPKGWGWKTTLSINIASTLALAGYSVLLNRC